MRSTVMRKRRIKAPSLVRSRPWRVLLLLIFVTMLALGAAGPALAQERHALVAEVDGMINPVTQRYISRVVSKGDDDGAEIVIIKLDTPGGLLSSTRKIVEDLLNAHVPTAVYVYPRGAHAASAGTFITAAANFAVMAPGTNIGAAAPVASGGDDIPETLKGKVIEDTAALMRSIAEQRNRNTKALEDTVRLEPPASYHAEQAVDLDVVDFIALNVDDMLVRVHGLTVEVGSPVTGGEPATRTLDTRGLTIREINMSIIEKFLFFLADPNVSFILLSLGGLGLVVEMFNPGLIVPGIVGVMLLILAFLSFGNLPVNWAAVGLILLAAILLLAEVFVSGFGVLGIAATVSFVLGGLLLFDSFGSPSPTAPSIRVSLWLLASLAGSFGLFGFWILRTTVRSRRQAELDTKEEVSPLIDTFGVVASDLAPRGTVHVAGEVWTAVTEDDIVIIIGERIKVLKADGPVLTVALAED